MHKVVAVLAAFSYNSSRLTALQILNPYIVDPENYTLIDSAFRNRSSRNQARTIIAARSAHARHLRSGPAARATAGVVAGAPTRRCPSDKVGGCAAHSTHTLPRKFRR